MKKRVAIVDCSISNLTSVRTAFEFLGAEVTVVQDPGALREATHVVLPGVGAFPRGMAHLVERGLDDAIRVQVAAGKPLIGLCLGMQLLADTGDEFQPTVGLGLIPGAVTKLRPNDPTLRLPHVGWNDVTFRRRSAITEELGDAATFYFVHSYGYEAPDHTSVLGTCDYGGPMVAVVERENVFGAQFHPEKSQKAGLALLRGFLRVC